MKIQLWDYAVSKVVVLDEADRLLASGPGSMLPDVETCLNALPPPQERQTCLFTATLTPEVMALKYIPRGKGRPPIFVCEVDTSDLAVPPTLKQTYLQVPLTYRETYLHILLLTARNAAKKSIIIFCNRTATANLLERLLRLLEHRVTSLHSLLPQRERTDNFSSLPCLCCSHTGRHRRRESWSGYTRSGSCD